MEIGNEAVAEVRHRKSKLIEANVRILDAEIRNLLDEVGDGYTGGDYYAKTRYYSTICGVKNFRIYESEDPTKEPSEILVKILSPKGKLLPKEITVRNIKYKITFVGSKNYDPTIDY